MIRINNIVAIKGLIGSFKDKTIFMMLVKKLSFDVMHLCQSANIRKWRKQYEKEKDEAFIDSYCFCGDDARIVCLCFAINGKRNIFPTRNNNYANIRFAYPS